MENKRRVRSLIWSVIVGLFVARSALADTSVFRLSGTLQDGGTLTGFLDVSGSYVNADRVVVADGGYSYSFTGSFFQGIYDANGAPAGYESVAYDRAGNGLTFSFPEVSLAGFGGGSLCSLTAPCVPENFGSSYIFFDGSGGTTDFTTLVASPIPEPGTLALVGTGVLSLTGAWRRRRILRGRSCVLLNRLKEE